MDKILTILIPSYNMQNYLPQCIESLLVNLIEEIEIIIINDGSTDGTLQVARKYEKMYPESIHVIDKQNGNYGSCINAGLKISTGKYIKVLDADDSFEHDNFNLFINYLKNLEVDLVVSDYIIVNENGDAIDTFETSHKQEKRVYSFIDSLDILSLPLFQMHAVTYRTELLKALDYRQVEGISYTDQQWMFEPMTTVQNVAFYRKFVYRYLIGREGQTIDHNVSLRQVDQTILVVEKMLENYVDVSKSLDEGHRNYLKTRLLQKIPSLYRIVLLKSKNDKLNSRLIEFDRKLSSLDSQLYESTAVDSFMKVKLSYVKYWRNCIKRNIKPRLLTPLRWAIMSFYM